MRPLALILALFVASTAFAQAAPPSMRLLPEDVAETNPAVMVPASVPVYKREWFWVAVGASVVTTAVVGFVAAMLWPRRSTLQTDRSLCGPTGCDATLNPPQ